MKRLFLTLIICSIPQAWAQSRDLTRASGEMAAASGHLLSSSFQLSGEIVLTIGEPLSHLVIEVVRGSGIIIKGSAIASMDLTTSVLDIATTPIAASSDFLSSDPEAPPVLVEHVLALTPGDALALIQSVENGQFTLTQKQLLQDLSLNPNDLKNAAVMKNDALPFAQDQDDLIFAIQTDKALLLVSLAQLENL